MATNSRRLRSINLGLSNDSNRSTGIDMPIIRSFETAEQKFKNTMKKHLTMMEKEGRISKAAGAGAGASAGGAGTRGGYRKKRRNHTRRHIRKW